MSATAYFEGKFVPEEEAKINIRTHAFLYGSSVFEGIRGYWNEETQTTYLFRAKEHYERLLQSAKLLFLEHTLTMDKLLEISVRLVEDSNFKKDSYLQPRIYKSGFVVPPRLDNVESDFCCFTVPLGDYLDLSKGLNVCVSNWRRVSDNAIPPRGKIGGSYVNSGLAMAEAHMNGFDDSIVLTEEGKVSEGSSMNFFMVKNGVILTSRTTDCILEGITRTSIIEIAAKELGLTVEVRAIDRTELYLADEVFFTGTAAQVAPVASIDHYKIGADGKPGEITMKLQALYLDIAKGKIPRYNHWLTPIKSHARIN